MKTAYIDFIKYAIAKGCTVSVWDGEDWQVKKSTKQRECIDAVKSVEEATLRVRDNTGAIVCAAYVSAYGLDSDETMIDWTDNQFGKDWEAHFFGE